jgi:hypothetical protein
MFTPMQNCRKCGFLHTNHEKDFYMVAEHAQRVRAGTEACGMVAVRKKESKPKTRRMTKAEKRFFAAVKKPKRPTKYLKEMFRLYGSKTATSEGRA